MRKETYYCDRCKKEKTHKEIRRIAITTDKFQRHGPLFKSISMDICKKCQIDLKLIRLEIEGEEVVVKPQENNEERIKSILKDLIHECLREGEL